jgi:hypothetical protein
MCARQQEITKRALFLQRFRFLGDRSDSGSRAHTLDLSSLNE